MDQQQINDDELEKILKQRMNDDFNPSSPAYQKRQEDARILADERARRSHELSEGARVNDLVGGILKSGEAASSIGGEKQGNINAFDNMFANSKNMRAQSLDLEGLSGREDAARRESENKRIYEYLQDRKEDRRHKETIDAMKSSKAETARTKADEKVDKEVTQLSEKLDPIRQGQVSVKNVERELGFDLDEYDSDTNTVRGKEVDAPGVSLPIVGRITKYDKDAKSLDRAMSGLLNTEIKDRAGSAVSSGEMERVKTEYAAGKYDTEEDLIRAMKDYKKAMYDELKRREAGYKPEALAEYKTRGGKTADDYAADKTPFSSKSLVKKGDAVAAPAGPKIGDKMTDKNGVPRVRTERGWEVDPNAGR